MCNVAPFTVEKILPLAGIELSPLDQYASTHPTKVPGLLFNMVIFFTLSLHRQTDGWMACNFMTILSVFQYNRMIKTVCNGMFQNVHFQQK